MGDLFKEIEDDALIADLLTAPQRTRTKSTENRAIQGEYNQYAIQFFSQDPPRKAIEIEIAEDSTSPFAGRSAQAVAQGFRNALKRAGIDRKRVEVITDTNGGGKPTVYLINVALVRPTTTLGLTNPQVTDAQVINSTEETNSDQQDS